MPSSARALKPASSKARIAAMNLVRIIIGFGYVGIVATIFAESGLLMGFFLPGDSLLFTAGFLASQGIFAITPLVAACVIAAIAGDSVGYAFGRRVGPKLFAREDSIIFNRAHLARTQQFYERYGAKTILLARFVPVVRTFAPILAGIGAMRYRTFLAYNIIGAGCWSAGLPLAGYFLGRSLPNADRYIHLIVIGIILVSITPPIVHVLRSSEDRAHLWTILQRIMSRKRPSA